MSLMEGFVNINTGKPLRTLADENENTEWDIYKTAAEVIVPEGETLRNYLCGHLIVLGYEDEKEPIFAWIGCPNGNDTEIFWDWREEPIVDKDIKMDYSDLWRTMYHRVDANHYEKISAEVTEHLQALVDHARENEGLTTGDDNAVDADPFMG